MVILLVSYSVCIQCATCAACVCVCVQWRTGSGGAMPNYIISVNVRRVIDTKPTAPAAHGPCQIRTKGTLTPSFIFVYVIIIHSCTFRLYYIHTLTQTLLLLLQRIQGAVYRRAVPPVCLVI